ncbi:MAG: HlyD family efflux transporter periplasmic adaptor subunit [Chloroflexi bacterium]|nr:HlyD family efflux transporter periplasmic adaptor subunit [Chloroflexota bacterium]
MIVSRRAFLSFALMVALATVGCGAVVGTSEPATPTPVPQADDAGKQTYVVERGSIFDTIKGLGRIAAQTETPLYFKEAGRIGSVNVAILDSVKKGDLLAQMDAGDLGPRIERARIEIDIAQIEHARTVANSASARSDLTAASASLVGAQNALTRARVELARLEEGPTAEQLDAALASRAGALSTYHRASAHLANLRENAPREATISAESGAARALAALARAQADYDAVAWRPGVGASAVALALAQATTDNDAAQAALRISRRTSAEDLTLAERSAEAALQAYRAAEARLEQVRAGARNEDVAVARLGVARAEAALADQQAAYEAAAANARVDTASFDVQMAAKRLEAARVRLRGLEEELEAKRIRAPYDGVITFITGKQGEQFQAFNPIAIISNPTILEVSVEFDGTTLARVSTGQQAIVMTDAFGTTEIRGKVVRLPTTGSAPVGPQSTTNPRAIRVSFEPPGAGAQVGQLAQVTVVTQQKDDVILVPNSAVRRFGSRRYVQTLVDGRRRDVDIQTGLVTETVTEVTKGLSAGRIVIVP